MKENEKNKPIGFKTDSQSEKEQDPKNKDSKNNQTDNPTDVKDGEEGEINNPEKNREHDDRDHEHDYKTPGDIQIKIKNKIRAKRIIKSRIKPLIKQLAIKPVTIRE
jgi:hypothetical protein